MKSVTIFGGIILLTLGLAAGYLITKNFLPLSEKSPLPVKGGDGGGLSSPPPADAIVSEVIDPITIRLNSGHIVRYIGVTTPKITKPVECFGREAMQANENIIGQRVRLESESLLLRSADGSWTRYVWLIQGEVDPKETPSDAGEGEGAKDPKDILINEAILEGGFGFPVVAENMVYGERLLSAARFASATGKGLWSRCEATKNETTGQFSTQETTECVIKGKKLGEGEGVFRAPACSAYQETIVKQSQGDQWFCSEDEATQAGFERAPDCG